MTRKIVLSKQLHKFHQSCLCPNWVSLSLLPYSQPLCRVARQNLNRRCTPCASPTDRRESCDRVRDPIRIFIDSIPPPKPPELGEEIREEEEDEIKGAEEAAQEMRNEATKGHRDRPWARKEGRRARRRRSHFRMKTILGVGI